MGLKISVLLPTHNKAALLSFAIRSVLAQTFQDFEVLIAGDGCTDDTAQVVKEFNDPRLRWFDLPKAANFGYANRNIVLREARGDLIAFMAHDDLWMTDHLERLIPAFDNSSMDFAYSRPLWVIPKGRIVPGFFNITNPQSLHFFLNKGNRIPAACVMHRRDCLERFGYWDESLSIRGDWDMWKRIILGGGKNNFSYLNEPTCLHFKADWHRVGYDLSHNFPAWIKLFDGGQMPPALEVTVDEEVSEQEAVWRVMNSDPHAWNISARAAVNQVTDLLAYAGIAAYPNSLDLNNIKPSIARRLINRTIRLFAQK